MSEKLMEAKVLYDEYMEQARVYKAEADKKLGDARPMMKFLLYKILAVEALSLGLYAHEKEKYNGSGK